MMPLLLLVFASGGAGLVYQVLWMRLCALLFGNTAFAAAAVLSGFLFGLAVGYHLVGSRRRWRARPLRVYAGLELATGLLALPIPWILALAETHYPAIHAVLAPPGSSGWLLIAAKAAAVLLLLLPATAAMGGTLPALGDVLVRQASGLGRRGGLLYGVNTAGAMAGALAAGFWLPAAVGVRHTYLLAVGINLMVGIVAWWWSRYETPVTSPEDDSGRRGVPEQSGWAESGGASRRLAWRVGSVIAGVSGFCLLGLEVLWTRMFAQVLQNSVYSYAAIVITVLAGLACAALLVSWRSRGGRRTTPATLAKAAVFAGAATLATPFLFYLSTGGVQYQWMSESWGWYLLRLFALVTGVIGPAVVIGGMVFPLVWRLWEPLSDDPGSVVGRTAAINTWSAVLGALAAGFLFLPTIGLWRSLFVYAGLWFAAAVWAGRRREDLRPGRGAAVSGWMGLAAAGGFMLWASTPAAMPVVTLDPGKGERVLEVREGSQAIVAVVDQLGAGDRRLKVDNFYTLGGVAARADALLQGQLPLLLHPRPERVLYIGSATGIPPAGALAFPVDRIVAVELIPDVIELARRHFREANQGVYDHPAVNTVAADGRNYLLASRERFDAIIADLFVPWHAGTGSMYSLELFSLASSRLNPGGVFCQWLPLYQLSPGEFRIIAATFLRAFPHATLWRGDFYPDRPIVALIGHEGGVPIDLAALDARLARLRAAAPDPSPFFRDLSGVLMLYAGNLSQAAGRFAGEPINTDDRPLLEYLAPRVGDAEPTAAGKTWFVGRPLSAFYRELHTDVIERDDPLVPHQQLKHREYRLAGELFYAAQVMTAMGRSQEAGRVLERIAELVPDELLVSSGRKGAP